MDFLNLNLDKTLSGNSNTTISSQKALKSYIDAKRILLNFLQDQPPTTYNTGDKWLNTSTKKLYIATSSSNWGNPIDLNIDQVYSFENLFYHYDGTDILNYSTESITEQNNNYEIKTWFGTQNEYDALDNYDANTLYNIVDNASILSSLLATQTEFNNSVSNKAATPYQVNQALGNYLPLAGGNLDAGAVLRLTNTNNNTVALAYNTNNYLTISNNLSVSGNITTNSLIASTGNIYNGSTTGPKVIWNNNYATSSTAGIVKPDNTTLTVDNTGTLTVIGGTGGGGSVILLQFLQSTTPTTYSTNDKWLNISDYKLYTATSSSTWDSGQSITEDQIFGFNNLLYHYDGTNLIIYSTESVKNQNDGVEIKTWVGTQDEYDSISTYDNNTIYNIINSDTSITNQYHPPLLSFKWSEHKFNSLSWLRADTFSWQNGNVYKAAYNHLLDDYNNATESSTYINSNIYINGSITNNNGIISGFSTNNYARTNTTFNFSTADTWSIITKHNFTSVGSVNDGLMGILGGAYNINYYVNTSNKIVVELSSNGSSYNIGTLSTINAITLNEDFYLKSEFTGTEYNLYYGTNLSNMTLQATITSSTKVSSRDNYFAFGVDEAATHTSWTGSIDLSGCSITLDDTVVWKGINTITYYKSDDGHKIVLADQETAVQNIYNATGNARYFILDTTNTHFKLPRWKHNKYQAKAPVVGNGTALGLTNGTLNGGLHTIYAGNTGTLIGNPNQYGQNVGHTDATNTYLNIDTAVGITSDPTKSGIEATLEEDDMYLYFYVGNFTQSAIEQTAGLNSELLNGKVDISSLEEVQCVVETYSNGTEWYRIWSDGWCEQGGYIASGQTGTATFLKAYSTLPSVFFGNITTRASSSYDREKFPNSVTTTGFTYTNVVPSGGVGVNWMSVGYII